MTSKPPLTRQRVLTSSQKTTYYFHIRPSVIPEIAIAVSICFMIGLFPDNRWLMGWLFIVIASFFLHRKIKEYQYGIQVWTYGTQTVGKVVRFEKVKPDPDSRAVYTYRIQYEADGKMFNHEQETAYSAGLYEGSKTTLFFLPGYQKHVFIPKFYGM